MIGKERNNFWGQTAKRPFNLIAWYKTKKKRCRSRMVMAIDSEKDSFDVDVRCKRILGHRGDHAYMAVCWNATKNNKDVVSGSVLMEWETYGDWRSKAKR